MAIGVSLLVDGGGSLLVKKGDTSFGKVYKRKVGGTMNYLWITTDAYGNKLNRGGQIKNTVGYTSLANAEAIIPLGYSNALGEEGDIAIVNQYGTGLSGDSSYQIDNGGSFWYHYPNGEWWAQVSIEPVGTHVSVTLDTRGFGSDPSAIKFKIENSTDFLTKTELEEIDFSNMKGRDVSILACQFISPTEIEEVKQSVVHFAGDNTTDMPSFYKRNSTRRLAQLPYVFPAFGTLSGKINILSFGQLDGSFNFQNLPLLSRGFNVIDWKANPEIPYSNRLFASYDEWAYDHGCPKQDGPGAIAWLESKPIDELYGYFRDAVIIPAAGHLAAFVDFEAWTYYIEGSVDGRNKIASLWRAFKAANPDTKLMSYVGSRNFASSILGNITEAQMNAENAKYTQDISAVARQFSTVPVSYMNLTTGAYDGTTGYLADYLDVINAGDYQHFISHSWFYSTIQEMELAKLFKPEKLVMPLMWSYVETVPGDDFNSVRRYYRRTPTMAHPQEWFFCDYKIAVPFSHLYNHAAWGNFLGDGIWNWHDPYPSLEGFDFWGGAGKDPENSTLLPENFSDNHGMLEVSTTIGYDYEALAIYELSFNADILNGGQPILKPEFSTNGGSSWYSGEYLKPASADYYHLPVVRIRKHPTLNEWLVLAVNRYNEQYNNQAILVKIPGTAKTRELILKGQFTTIKRLKLL